MDCNTALALLDPYLDGELDRADARELEAHVEGCADCRAALTNLDELRLALRHKALRYSAPPALRDRLLAANIVADAFGTAFTSSTRSARRRAPSWLRVAAACVLAFGAGGVFVHFWNSEQIATTGQAQVARDLFASHWRALAAATPVDVVSSDQHTVKPWFAGKVAEAPLVRDFAEQGFALVGGRIDYIDSERVAVLVYRHGRHLIDVFVLPQIGRAEIGGRIRQRGYTLYTTALGGQTAAVLSDMDDQETTRFMQLLPGTE